MLKDKIQIGTALYALLLVLAAYYFGLFIDLTADTGKYGAIARHILDSGDWINLKIHGEPYDQKPPLIFWLATLGFELGGLHNWSYKLFSVLYSFGGFWFTYRLGKTLYTKRTGVLAALMLFSSEVYFLFAMDVHTDLLLQANITLAIWQLAAYLKTRKTLNFVLAFTGVGLAMMSKGAIGAAIPAFALGTHLLIKRDFRQLVHPKWLLGILIALIVALPAFAGLYNQFGLEGLKFFFITNNVGRITGSYAGNNSDYLFYFHTILYLFLPWTFLLFFGLYHEIKSYFLKSGTNREYFTVGGIWIYFLIASIAKGKAPHYIFTLIPLFAVIVGKWLDFWLQETDLKNIHWLFRAQYLVLALIIVFLVTLMGYGFPSNNLLYWVLLVTSLAACFILVTSEGELLTKLFLPSIILMATLNIYLNAQVFPETFSYQASTHASRIYNEKAAPGEPLSNYLYGQYELFFYADTDVKQLYSLKDFKLNPVQNSWIFTTQQGLDSIHGKYQNNIELVYPLKHQGMNKVTIKFLNPETREQALKPMYLLKLNPKIEQSETQNSPNKKP
ncbi:ArnT family glycosyltransferase [Mangrovibacterium sp.]|uniref:ArnT family glycosyltransferase n=1 Tax=Mangrovibacterium sp. TaxID=1961364 RepID=UPI00356548BB